MLEGDIRGVRGCGGVCVRTAAYRSVRGRHKGCVRVWVCVCACEDSRVQVSVMC